MPERQSVSCQRNSVCSSFRLAPRIALPGTAAAAINTSLTCAGSFVSARVPSSPTWKPGLNRAWQWQRPRLTVALPCPSSDHATYVDMMVWQDPRVHFPDETRQRHLSVTVVVPNYNHAKYLEQSLSSIAAQIRQPDRSSLSTMLRRTTARNHRRVSGPLSGLAACTQRDQPGVISTQSGIEHGARRLGHLSRRRRCAHPDYLRKVMNAADVHPTSGLICACVERFESSAVRELRPIVFPRLTDAL